ncbi:MAG: hypothetical protein AAGJ80_17860 [Cyanobacteria bacterium J06553_1]
MALEPPVTIYIGNKNNKLFRKMDMTFLEEDVETWEDIDSFQSSRSKVHGINVVSNPAERAVKLTT